MKRSVWNIYWKIIKNASNRDPTSFPGQREKLWERGWILNYHVSKRMAIEKSKVLHTKVEEIKSKNLPWEIAENLKRHASTTWKLKFVKKKINIIRNCCRQTHETLIFVKLIVFIQNNCWKIWNFSSRRFEVSNGLKTPFSFGQRFDFHSKRVYWLPVTGF